MLNIISLLKWLVLCNSAWNKLAVTSYSRKLPLVMTVVCIASGSLDDPEKSFLRLLRARPARGK